MRLNAAQPVSTLLGPTNNHSATYGILLLGAVLVFAWLVVTSVALVSRARDASPSPHPGHGI